MENAHVSSAQSAQRSAEQFVIRTLNYTDVQSLRALHASSNITVPLRV